MEAMKENNNTLMFAERKQTIWNPKFSVYLEKQTFVCEIRTFMYK